MSSDIVDGVWPTMITPFSETNQVDQGALRRLVDWYIDRGVDGLFAVCQSSEMFVLSLSERVELARSVVKYAAGRVPVIASGHISETISDQADEVRMIADTGVEAVVLVSNRFAGQEESDEVWKRNLERFLALIPEEIALGFYECPFPYKRLFSPELLSWTAALGRFRFLKDTCCDLPQLQSKIAAVRGTGLKVFNANTATLLGSLQAGAAGFSGVMANFHPELYVKLCRSWNAEPAMAAELQDFLGTASLIERVAYPMCAKYHQQLEGTQMTLHTRRMSKSALDSASRLLVEQLRRLAGERAAALGITTG
ncbi:MAG TPA: dihydrodipicolinate synthase family protein [Spirochaetia bacterium]|nr:dihydrodipicolinate synthase family protein [Spirochaetia bacterium]